jgi:hypothetical protein
MKISNHVELGEASPYAITTEEFHLNPKKISKS